MTKSRYKDNYDGTCEMFMNYLHKEFRGKKAEISSHMFTKKARLFAGRWHIKEATLLDALIRRGWIEPSAADTYHINYQKVRK